MKISKKQAKILFYFLMFLPLVLAGAAFGFLPDRIPAHYGWNGEVNRYGSRAEIFGMPIATILLGWFFLFMARLSSRYGTNGNTNSEKFTTLASIFALLVFNILTIAILYSSLNAVTDLFAIRYDGNRLILSAIAVMFIVAGNFMPKLKRNGIAGLRTKWSLSSEETWEKSQRFGGASSIITGVILFIGNFLPLRGTQIYIFAGVLIVLLVAIDALYTRKVSDHTK